MVTKVTPFQKSAYAPGHDTRFIERGKEEVKLSIVPALGAGHIYLVEFYSRAVFG